MTNLGHFLSCHQKLMYQLKALDKFLNSAKTMNQTFGYLDSVIGLQ